MTDSADTVAADFLTLIERLARELDEHERAAREIRETLATVRKRLAATPGARAGKHARSGKRRKPLTLIDDERAVSS